MLAYLRNYDDINICVSRLFIITNYSFASYIISKKFESPRASKLFDNISKFLYGYALYNTFTNIYIQQDMKYFFLDLIHNLKKKLLFLKNLYANSNANLYVNSNANLYANPNANLYVNSNANLYANPNADIYSNLNENPNPNTDTDIDIESEYNNLDNQIKILKYSNGDIYHGLIDRYKKKMSNCIYYEKKSNTTYFQKWTEYGGVLIGSKVWKIGNYIGLDSKFKLDDNISDDEFENIKCIISYNIMIEPILLSCGHTFDKIYLIKNMMYRNTCPLCKTEIRNYIIDKNILEKIDKYNFSFNEQKISMDDIREYRNYLLMQIINS
jgi:hypothetical protein